MLDREILVVDDEKRFADNDPLHFWESAGIYTDTKAASGQEASGVMAKKYPASSFWM